MLTDVNRFVPKIRDTELLIFRMRLEEVSFSFSLSGYAKLNEEQRETVF